MVGVAPGTEMGASSLICAITTGGILYHQMVWIARGVYDEEVSVLRL